MFQIKEHGNLTALKTAPLNPPGFDPKVVKTWAPDFDQYVKLQQCLARGVEQDLRLSPVGTAPAPHSSIRRIKQGRDGANAEIVPTRDRGRRDARGARHRPGPIRSARADRGGQEGRRAGSVYGQHRRGRAGHHQCVQQALSVREGGAVARARRTAHHPREDRGRSRQDARRRARSLRSGFAGRNGGACSSTTRRPMPVHTFRRPRSRRSCGRASRWSGRSPTTPHW